VLGQCRAYRYSDALKLIEAEPLRSQWSGYLYALALEGAGRKEDALEHLQRAEGLHQSMICRPTLAPGRMDLAGGYDKLPHELAASHVLRREAWQKIRGESPPDDRWWHLIQARGYGLLEESERAEKEFAAAVAEAPDDPEIWIARALVFEQLGDAARAENDRNRAAKLGAGAEASGSASPRK